MKKLLTLAAVLLMGSAAAMAQEAKKWIQFVDENGVEVKDGSVFVVKEVTIKEDPDFGTKETFMQPKLSLKNVTDHAIRIQMRIDATQMPNGRIQCCMANACKTKSESIVWASASAEIAPAETMFIETEWFLDKTAPTWDMKLTGQLCEDDENESGDYPVADAKGPEVTVRFVSDPTAITGISTDKEANAVVARYNVAGQQISAPQKGINIVKYANGKTARVVVK